MLVNQVDASYNTPIWNGINDHAKGHDCNIYCFVGRSFNPAMAFEYNAVYKLIDTRRLDGIILFSGTLSNYIDMETYLSYIEPLRDVPIVSIAENLEGVHSIMVDDFAGMREVIIHLIEVHQYRRIAFIRGPETSEDANGRYAAYCDVLNQYKIPFDPELVVAGEFNRESGMAAFDALYGKKGVKYEAIVSSNDDMLIGALLSAERRGLKAPDNFAITGFDDIFEMHVHSPSITTIRQPLYEQGRKACENLLKIIRGEDVPLRTKLPPKLIIRQSCGCLTNRVPEYGYIEKKVKVNKDPLKILHENREDIIAETLRDNLFNHEDLSAATSNNISVLFSALLKDLSDKKIKGELIKTINFLFARNMETEEDVLAFWQRVLYSLYNHIQVHINDSSLLNLLSLIIQQGHISLADFRQKFPVYNYTQFLDRLLNIRIIIQRLITTFNYGLLIDVLSSYLPSLSVTSCFIALYEGKMVPYRDFASWNLPGEACLIFAYDDDTRLEIDSGNRIFPSRDLVPPNIALDNHRHTYLIYPIFFRENQFGFILIEYPAKDIMIYDLIREQISSACMGAYLFDEQKKTEKRLEQSNRELELFAYKASHDLQEPLRMVSSFVQLLKYRYQDKLDSDANEFINFAVEGSNRMKDMINGLLAYSRVDSKGEELVPVDFEVVLKKALMHLMVIIEERNAKVTHDQMPKVMGDTIQLIILMQNLIHNSIKFCPDKSPEIHIGCREEKDKWIISVKDNGIGINQNHLDKIFMIFYRYHPKDQFPGTGMGLAICKRIVERHGGRIWVESKEKEGAVFHFSLPMKGLK